MIGEVRLVFWVLPPCRGIRLENLIDFHGFSRSSRLEGVASHKRKAAFWYASFDDELKNVPVIFEQFLDADFFWKSLLAACKILYV